MNYYVAIVIAIVAFTPVIYLFEKWQNKMKGKMKYPIVTYKDGAERLLTPADATTFRLQEFEVQLIVNALFVEKAALKNTIISETTKEDMTSEIYQDIINNLLGVK